jgi:hypothetical protein
LRTKDIRLQLKFGLVKKFSHPNQIRHFPKPELDAYRFPFCCKRLLPDNTARY